MTLDQNLFFRLNRDWTAEWLDKPMATLSSFDFWIPILILIGLALFIWGGFRGRACLVCIGLCIGLVDGIVVKNLKDIVGRPRPGQVLKGARILDLEKAKPRFLALAKPVKEDFSDPEDANPRGGSFPSGHTANNFTLGTVLTAFYRRRGWWYFLPALAVSYSRIYVGSHFPFDVLASMVIAVSVTLLALWAISAIWRAAAPRVVPQLAKRHPGIFD